MIIDDAVKSSMVPIVQRAKELADQHKQNRSKQPPIIAVASCKGAGKSYFANQLQEILGNQGCNVLIINQNGFMPYKDIALSKLSKILIFMFTLLQANLHAK